MEEEKQEEQTSENPVEEETTEEETSSEEQVSQEPETVSKEEYDELKKKNEQLYARVKKAEAKPEKVSPQEKTELDPEEVAKTMAAFEGLDNDERVRLIQESRLKGISLNEARKDEDFKLWQGAHSKKVEKTRKSPGSTSPGSGARMEKSFKEIADMTPEEHQAYDSQMMKENTGGI